MSTNQTTLSDKIITEELQRKVKQLNNENSNLLMQVTELIMKNYDLAQSLQMKIVKDPSVRPAPEHPPVMECSVTTVTADRECAIQNQQNSPVKIKSGKANQKKNQQHQQIQKQSNASESETETKQADNRNQKQQQQKRSERQQQQQSKLKLNQDGGDNAEIPRMEKEDKPKPTVALLPGDSILKNIKGWLMSRTKAVKSYSFSRADADDMKYHQQPIIKRNPHHIVLHCGTNDLAWRTPEEIATNITGLVKEIKGNNIECSVSAVLKRSDELSHKVIKVNKLLKTALVELNVQFIEHVT